ncbi:MAG: Membrane-associated HD superfamily phosphohydrolase [Chloroflexi bacterium AL-W]|nr:Membrane-associated HD superfamily phosphohydrolase [Chloroflexi bacterium AL-N1]NOK64543.1 Membrane-associated HD superfamily phosphohydrolase [Chloroflexi bacterium AL-N10]NOK75785.1 Membrane-associated HD superfamily phosphohydrolase [Chloroflexi bacterium AL-N5]NOK80456.1 Membrane-associated HD superfamily phosphohydrolase [Chloroflexi bacterium AL-W]NOK86970.1 Membrane-associated HD superfamily phosphohydrolase [Chloroflexi bacterium AL-N15]
MFQRIRKIFHTRHPRSQRRARAPLTGAAQERRQRVHLTLATALLAAFLWGILGIDFAFEPPLDVEVGMPSPREIIAHQTKTFESEFETNNARDQAAANPELVQYSNDETIIPEQRNALQLFFDTVTSIRENDSLSRVDKTNELEGLMADLLPNASSELAAEIVQLDEDTWNEVQARSLSLYNEAVQARNYQLREDDVRWIRDTFLPLANLGTSEDQRALIVEFSGGYVRANRFFDAETTRQRQLEARNAVEPVQTTIQNGQTIVRKGDIITEKTKEQLDIFNLTERETNWRGLGGTGLLCILVAFAFGSYIGFAQRSVWLNTRALITILSLFALNVFADRLLFEISATPEWWYIFPLAATILILMPLFNLSLALVTAALLSVLIVFVSDGEFELGVALLLSSMAGVFIVKRGDRSITFLLAGLAVGLVVIITRLTFWLITPGDLLFEDFQIIVIAGLINGLLSALLSLGLYNVVGNLGGITTPLQLMELSHPSQPLLRKLMLEAPGSYYHSIAVGNLAERAAEAINADALLLRVAAYYHDIGKTIRPYFFTDNQSERENVHNDLDPRTSAEIIVEHVREGANMARAAKLPKQIIDFIITHHGTTTISHFYQLALQQEDSVDINDFRYPGPKPQTREQAILMLADSVEATVRSKSQSGKLISSRHTETNGNGSARNGGQTLEELVRSIIDERVRSGQLDESPITLHDIAQIRQAFVNSLQGIYHPRTDYAPQIVRQV